MYQNIFTYKYLMYQLVPEHFLRVKVGDEKADVVALNFLPPQDDKVFCPPHHESHEHLAQEGVDIVQLLDGNGHPHRVDAGLDHDRFLLIPGDDDRVEQKLRALPDLDLRLVVSFNLLTGEVLHTHGRLQRPLHTDQVGVQCVGHLSRNAADRLFARQFLSRNDLSNKPCHSAGLQIGTHVHRLTGLGVSYDN